MPGELRVLKQQQVFSTLEDGSVGQVVRITFRTPLGVIGQVEVPARTYSADTARDAIAERAKHLDEVQAI